MKNPINIQDLCDYRYLSNVKISNDKKRAVFVVSQGSFDENKYRHNLYCYDFNTGKTNQITSGNEEKSFIFENDETLLFVADRDGSAKKAKEKNQSLTSYYRLSLNGGEALKAFSVDLNVNSLKLIDQNQILVNALVDLGKEGMSEEQIEEEKAVQVLDELPFWFNGRGFINKLRKQVYLVDTVTNEKTCLTPKMMDVQYYDMTSDKQWVIVVGDKYDSVDRQFSKILKINLVTKEVITILEDQVLSIHDATRVNDTLVFTATDYKKYGSSENVRFYKMELSSNEIECFLDPDFSVGSSVGSDARLMDGISFKGESNALYTLLTTDNCSNLYRIELDGTTTQLTFGEGSVDCFDVVDDKIVFIGMRNLELQELFIVNDQMETKVTKINDSLNDKEVLPLNKISFINDDGIRIDGWVIEPRGYDPMQSYPAIFDIHGGPKTVYGEVFFHEMQVWASNGYFAYFCNPRGSDGRGNAFMDLVNKYGTVDYRDLMDFKAEVLKRYPAIDPCKNAVTGGSYGGFMVNWMIGHTHDFVCAASQRSIANWVSKSLTTDIGYWHNMSQMASTPWTDFERMWSFSPLKYADQCTTPTLFIHSDEDYRCWMSEALQMFHALKLHGCETRLCLFKGENHGLSRGGKPKNRARRLNEMTNWFNKYCL